ncbi:MAG: 16S rRNA (guanine(527)-N(7))-methyltransferase RsmG [Polyangiaceae bacterium]|nr:16S rRNA (guanine(527)-N(7))-methyltransferase RsmG [Polyangiaceae bacterium]
MNTEEEPAEEVVISLEKEDLLRRYLNHLLEENQRMNLTALRSPEEAWNRHIVESVRVAEYLGSPQTLLDVGSGGGVPGMVFAIMRPDIQVTLLESVEKKARFLETAGELLGLKNLKVRAGRAELLAAPGEKMRESFDCVTARAVAAMPTLLELTIPFLKVGGEFIAIKGQKAEEEMRAAAQACRTLSVELTASSRQPTATILSLKKTGSTPQEYPRRNGEPKRKPL